MKLFFQLMMFAVLEWISTNGNRLSFSNDIRPNVVFILADDLGWSDTSLYGTSDYYQTPNVVKLAERGILFTRAYSASPLCSPTRASILTGLHPARIGLTSPSCHLPKVVLEPKQGQRVAANVPSFPNVSVTRLDTRFLTLGKAFQSAGYATAHFGKWHLGHEPYSPLQHGFQIDIPHWPGPGPAGSYVAPWKFPDFDPDTPDEHIEDRMAREAVKFIENHKDKPFFLNYWMFSVHAPFDAKSQLIEKYKKLLKPTAKQRSPTYAAMVESMDDAVGQLMQALDDNGLADNTIVVFFSDNGGNMYNLVDGVPATNNYPLRGGKATMFEGGVRVPCIMVDPRTNPGHVKCDRLVQSTDFFPTLIELSGLKLGDSVHFDGTSFADALASPGKKDEEGRAIFTYFPHQTRVPDWIPPSVSIHEGKWKLIRVFFGGAKGNHRNFLFDLSSDPGEKNNLASVHTAKVQDLGIRLDYFLKTTDALLPAKNPDFEFEKYVLGIEGKSVPRAAGKGSPRNKTKSKQKSRVVGGWRPGIQCRIKDSGKKLMVISTGKDPQIRMEFSDPIPAGKYRLVIEMASRSGGRGQFFWEEQGVSPKFIRDRSKMFSMTHDGSLRKYEIEFGSINSIPSIRLDPGQKPGQIEIQSIDLISEGKKPLHLLQLH